MGRIVTQLKIENFVTGDKLECDALVDTGACYVVLPNAWQERLGEFPMSRTAEVMLADQRSQEGQVCGPAKIQIARFEPVASEVLFLDMQPDEDDQYDILIGYVALEQSQLAVDMLGHRLVRIPRVDAKRTSGRAALPPDGRESGPPDRTNTENTTLISAA